MYMRILLYYSSHISWMISAYWYVHGLSYLLICTCTYSSYWCVHGLSYLLICTCTYSAYWYVHGLTCLLICTCAYSAYWYVHGLSYLLICTCAYSAYWYVHGLLWTIIWQSRPTKMLRICICSWYVCDLRWAKSSAIMCGWLSASLSNPSVLLTWTENTF